MCLLILLTILPLPLAASPGLADFGHGHGHDRGDRRGEILEALRERVTPRLGIRWLVRRGRPGARCQGAIRRGARAYLRERIRELHRGQRDTDAGRHLERVEEACDGVRAGRLPALRADCLVEIHVLGDATRAAPSRWCGIRRFPRGGGI